MARRNNLKGLFASFTQRDMRCPAFINLSHKAQAAIFWLDLNYWESQRANPIEMPVAWVAELLRCSNKTASKVIIELDDWGFITRERRGGLKGPVRERAAIYRLTWQRDNEGQNPTKDYLQIN